MHGSWSVDCRMRESALQDSFSKVRLRSSLRLPNFGSNGMELAGTCEAKGGLALLVMF